MCPQTDNSLLPEASIQRALKHLRDVLTLAFEHAPGEQAALLVFDADSLLSRSLAEAYRRLLPAAHCVEFKSLQPDEVRALFEQLRPKDLVLLVQSGSFRLDAFRIRLELFKRSLKVIEHPHLGRMCGEEAETYIDALAYDPHYYRGTGMALKARIDRAALAVIHSGGEQLVFSRGLEPAKLNIGDYTELPHVGGQYPIGEVFSESLELEAVDGRVCISFFGDTNFRVNRPPSPITLIVDRGRVSGTLHSTPEFDRVLANIQADEGQVWLRELGFGLNRAFTQERTVSDIGSFERMCGVHLSLGAKHASYSKPNIKKKRARHHVDVFVLTDAVVLDGEHVFQGGAWFGAASQNNG